MYSITQLLSIDYFQQCLITPSCRAARDKHREIFYWNIYVMEQRYPRNEAKFGDSASLCSVTRKRPKYKDLMKGHDFH